MFNTILAFSLSAILCVEMLAGRPRSLSANSVDEILWWLPEDTETVIVGRGPFTIAAADDKPATKLKQVLEQMSYAWLSAIQDGKLLKPMIGQIVLLSVEGSRRFRSPADLGSMPYEGCNVLIFQNSFSSVRDSFINLLEISAKEIEKIANQQVMVFEERLESDLWKLYVTLPRPDIVLCATDKKFLIEVLERMNSKAKRRALQEDLPEWRHVDTAAQFWAIRHYDKDNASQDPTSPLTGKRAAANAPDKEAKGITFVYNPGEANLARIRYLSASKERVQIATEYWKPASYKLNPQIRGTEPGVVDVSINPDSSDEFPIYLLILLAAFGHGIFI